MNTDLKSMLPEELQTALCEIGEKPYRAKQLYTWMHARMAKSYEEMTDLPVALRKALREQTQLAQLRPVEIQTSAIDGTKKILFLLPDGNVIESVWMSYKHGNSVCISSQVGCRMGCRFCASTIGGRVRDLSAAEMLEQVYRIRELTGERISNVVVMGTGEPLDNYENLVRFVRILSSPEGQNISQRGITVSTCGIVPQIRQLAQEHLAITLALSLHAVTQEKRQKLMPVANRYALPEVLDACEAYFRETGRRVTLEYALVRGENDSAFDARELARIAARLHGHVNLIPVNPVRERTWRRPDRTHVLKFKNNLEKSGINVTIRREMGADIDGACGQLRRKYLPEDLQEGTTETVFPESLLQDRGTQSP